ncbi:6-phosphofructokinase [Acidaminobacter hydrogenoformans DSM 2784]|uniref:ATP-dependent 6-phosphofructokinase n=1 Tax=Acidaminobacter hydrogenoformans DSM 2784 TaxID=1120920 RepID=A0A1G5S2W7_9FIRM|nr:6-phosphofructokinase [Acidaminobacter hydrogenoformans]SCZ79909.1 6-phosphofructokinase [Acidaminobacter hydrogenoformans DSM 2784]
MSQTIMADVKKKEAEKKIKRIGVLTSGGDAPGMNAAIRSTVRIALYNGLAVSGIRRGYQGLIEADIDDMQIVDVGDIINRGGTKLLTARSEDFMTEVGQKRALDVLRMFEIDGLVVIGGDGSFKGAKRLWDMGFPTIGIPGTIDNDLAYTDLTLGFDTAVSTVVSAINNLRDTSSSHGRVSIVEVMGRHCGDIALFAGLAGGVEDILVPERKFDLDEVARKILQGRRRGKLHSIILIAEGVGKSYEIAERLEALIHQEVRVTVLGYLQRGGTPSVTDRILGAQFGQRAVELLLEDKFGRVVGIRDNKIMDMAIEEALNEPKRFDQDKYDLAEILSL